MATNRRKIQRDGAYLKFEARVARGIDRTLFP